jgi:hypothetical protein
VSLPRRLEQENDVTQLVDQVDTRATQRLANTIGMLKIAVVSLIVLTTCVGAAADTGIFAVAFLLGGAVSTVCVYAVLSCLEHMLLLLIVVAHNTAKRDQPVPRDGQGDPR